MTTARERPVVRPPGLPARRSRVRRASSRFSPVRAGAAFVMVICALAIYGVGASPAFAFRTLVLDAGAAPYTSSDVVRSTLGLDAAAPNLFTLPTDQLTARLLALPPVREAQVTVALPNTISVRLVEREPILVWAVGSRRLLVDRDGRLFAPALSDAATDSLPLVTDRRAASAALDIGTALDPVDLDAATRLASIVPKDVGTSATALRVWIEDADGFELHPTGAGWVALFGVYTPSLRPTDLILGQVQLLRSFLAGRESSVKSVTLADDRNGTFVSR